MMQAVTRALFLASSALLLVMACAARSEQEIQAEFRAYVAAHNQCSSSEQCVLASAGCPLGCAVAVNIEHKGAVEKKAAELVNEYESGGRQCQYDCAVVVAACSEGHCELVAP